jgi:hypothetical protein
LLPPPGQAAQRCGSHPHMRVDPTRAPTHVAGADDAIAFGSQ